MHAADAGLIAAERAADMQEARIIGSGADFRAGVENAANFVGKHGSGYVGILDGEGAAEAAALINTCKRRERKAADSLQETLRFVANLKRTERMTRHVQRDGMREERTDIGDTEFIYEQLGKFEDARDELVYFADQSFVARSLSHFGEVIADHRHARGGRHADGFGAAKRLDEMAHELASLGVIAGVEMHLAATGLGGAEFDGVAQALEHGDDSFARLGEQGVVVASDEQGDEHGRIFCGIRAVRF